MVQVMEGLGRVGQVCGIHSRFLEGAEDFSCQTKVESLTKSQLEHLQSIEENKDVPGMSTAFCKRHFEAVAEDEKNAHLEDCSEENLVKSPD